MTLFAIAAAASAALLCAQQPDTRPVFGAIRWTPGTASAACQGAP